MAFQSRMKSMQPRRLQFQKKIKLLSGGYVRPESFPNGEITVYPWDAGVDDWLSERSKKGEQGTLLYDLCAHVCDLNGCPLDSFVIGDVNTVLLVSRAIRYNGSVEYECQCPACGYTTTETIKVPEELGRVGEKDPNTYPGWDEIVLPDCQDVVRVRPLQVKDEKKIATDDLLKKTMSERIMHILMPIVTINEGTPDAWEPVQIWYNALSPLDSAFLENEQNRLYPHLDTAIPHVCDRCRKKFAHTLDFSAEFFRSSLQPSKNPAVATVVRAGVGERGEANAQSEGRA